MIISLTGFMGCGKSSVGRRLSELLCCSFVDLDEVIVESEGRSIPEIFATEGEAAFRQKELNALKTVLKPGGMERVEKQSLPSQATGPSLCGQRGSTVSPPSPYHPNPEKQAPDDIILALGGGAVMTAECAEIVRKNTVCVYLRASVETLLEHLSGEADGRPMLAPSSHFDRATQTSCHFDRAERVEKSLELRHRIESLMEQRSAAYEKTAHITIDTDGRSIEAVASEIVDSLN